MKATAQLVLPAEFDAAIDEKVRAAVTDILATMPQQQAPKWFNLGQAADYASCARNTLTKWIKLGLKVSVIDGSQRIYRQDLDDFMNRNKI